MNKIKKESINDLYDELQLHLSGMTHKNTAECQTSIIVVDHMFYAY